jgi:hypothetical protein
MKKPQRRRQQAQHRHQRTVERRRQVAERRRAQPWRIWRGGDVETLAHEAVMRGYLGDFTGADALPAERETWPDPDLHRTLERLTDPEACLDLAARALAEEIHTLRGALPVPGGAGETALEDRH